MYWEGLSAGKKHDQSSRSRSSQKSQRASRRSSWVWRDLAAVRPRRVADKMSFIFVVFVFTC